MTFTPRKLDTATLDGAAKYFREQFGRPTKIRPQTGRRIAGTGLVVQDLHNLTFKDEFEYVVGRMLHDMGRDEAVKLRRELDQFEPRRDDVFENLLAEHLAITPDGQHIAGRIGKVQIGSRRVGRYVKVVPRYRHRPVYPGMIGRMFRRPITIAREQIGEARVNKSLWWPVYAGEMEEREAGSEIPDALPAGAEAFSLLPNELLATNPRIAAVAAIAACDAIVDLLDVGSTAATIRGRTGTQPADPDATESGTLLFTLTMSDPAFGAAADSSPGATATADTITDDSSADATGTLGYCRVGATGTSADDIIDGEAGTSGADFNFNTLSIVSGATVSMSSFTFFVGQSNS